MASAHHCTSVKLGLRIAPRLRRRSRLPARRCGGAAIASATNKKDEAAPPPAKRTPTRKRMIEALLRQSADKMLAAAAAKSAKSGSTKKAKPPPPPPGAADQDDDGDVLDLTAFLQRRQPAPAGVEPLFSSSGDDDEVVDGDALSTTPGAGEQGAMVDTWSYDTEDGTFKHRRVAAPRGSARAGGGRGSGSELTSLLGRLQAATGDEDDDDDDGVTFVDEDFDFEDDEEDQDDDGPWDVDAAERELRPQVRGKTALQRVDVKDLDEVIDALGGMDIRSLDKESQLILQEEFNRKLKERDKLVKRVPDRDNTPPDGKRKTHRQLHIIVGKAANYKLWSPQDMNTRPMMSAVRAAVFSMLTALWHGNGQTGGTFPGQLRWLDLFAGTGAVGIEALSRGAVNAHFVELDPWVTQQCLRRNLEHTQCASQAVVHTMTVEAYLGEAERSLRLAGGAAFDMISVCPPYDKVSYPELMATLERSPLVKPGTLLVVEFPKYERKTMVQRIGRLERVRDRRYGRTLVAVYECVAEDDSLLSDARAAERDRLDGWGDEEEDDDEDEDDDSAR